MGTEWLRICRESLKPAAAELMNIYASEERTVELSIGKGGDMTLIADKASEDIIIEKLHDSHVAVRLISEERGEVIIGKGPPQYTVLLDPLDGSFNFKNGLSYFGISMAVMDMDARPIAAYVMDVSQGTEYYATDEGAYRNGIRLQTGDGRDPDRVLLECSRGIDPEELGLVSRNLSRARHVRAPGSVALDLCRIAEGTFDCLLCTGGSRYLDVAAGIYTLERAGGMVSDFKGNQDIREGIELKTRNLIAAANRDILELILTSS